MQRIIMLLAVAALMAALVAGPASAAKPADKGAEVSHAQGERGTHAHHVETPSGNQESIAGIGQGGAQGNFHTNDQGGTVGNAVVPSECNAHANETPSGQVNDDRATDTGEAGLCIVGL
jgi:hypothetical protein